MSSENDKHVGRKYNNLPRPRVLLYGVRLKKEMHANPKYENADKTKI